MNLPLGGAALKALRHPKSDGSPLPMGICFHPMPGFNKIRKSRRMLNSPTKIFLFHELGQNVVIVYQGIEVRILKLRQRINSALSARSQSCAEQGCRIGRGVCPATNTAF